MLYAVSCPCGHTADRHDARGCRGSRDERCDCARDCTRAVEAAIDAMTVRAYAAPPDAPQPWIGK